MFFLLASLPALAGDMEITVTDPSVIEVQLACTGQTVKAPVVGGVAKFTGSLQDCSVSMVSTIGRIDSNDKYTCDRTGCSRNAIENRAMGDAPGRVTIVLTDNSTQLLELSCPSGYRERAPVLTNTAVFEGVPGFEDCDLWWKNAAPGKGRKIRPGTWYCQNNKGTGVCRRQ